jgi:Na+:H+ antiporter, NhaA family
MMVGLRLARLPEGASWRQMFALSMLCGIGFTMSLFIGMLAFNDPILQEEAKVGILVGSLVAGLGGYTLFRFSTPAPHS